MEALTERRPRLAATGVVLASLALVLVVTYGDALRVPFVGDDYFFLDKTRDAPVSVVWAPHELVSHYYRPWSRELHYWALQQVFGTREAPWHVVSFGLWLTAMGLYFTLVRRLAGTRVAGVAVAGVAALAAWGVPLVWVAGVQELWMLVWALATLQLVVRERWGWAAVTLALALLSKETAVVVPGVALGYAAFMGRARGVALVRKLVPMAAVVLVWAALHPLLGGRLLTGRDEPVMPGVHAPFATVALRSVLSVVSLSAWPRPEGGWGGALASAWPGAAVLGALVAWAARMPPSPAESRRGLVAFGVGWMVVAWAPFALPSLGWHAYYALFGALGAWLALAVVLAPRPVLAIALVSALAMLRPAVARTPTRDWGTEWFQRRAAGFTARTREELRALALAPTPHTRFFLTGLPGGVGLIAGGEESPVLRVWYRDRTLRAAFWGGYAPRTAVDTLGRDVFLRWDPSDGWREVVAGPEDVARARASNARWRDDHARLAATMTGADDWPGAAAELEKLAHAFPADAALARQAGLARAALGDSAGARRWFTHAGGAGR